MRSLHHSGKSIILIRKWMQLYQMLTIHLSDTERFATLIICCDRISCKMRRKVWRWQFAIWARFAQSLKIIRASNAQHFDFLCLPFQYESYNYYCSVQSILAIRDRTSKDNTKNRLGSWIMELNSGFGTLDETFLEWAIHLCKRISLQLKFIEYSLRLD